MKNQLTLIVAAKWQQYWNERNIDGLLKLTDEHVEVVDDKESNFGLQSLVKSIIRTGMTLKTLNSYVKEEKLVLKHRGIWKSDCGLVIKEAMIYSYIIMKNGKVAYLKQFECPEDAEAESGISIPIETKSTLSSYNT